MLEFKNLAYIDLQKTGSTTIISVLRGCLADEEIRKRAHGPVPKHFEPGKLTFISVREPVALYISLFNFGAAEKKGQLYAKLMKRGYPGLYEANVRGFERWVDFLTDPERAEMISPEYAKHELYPYVGLLSYRLLHMSVLRSNKALGKIEKHKRGIRRFLKQQRVYTDYVRTESLGTDLFSLFKRHEHRLSFTCPLTTEQELMSRVRTMNASTKIDGVDRNAISEELRQRVMAREWLFYEEFGYRDNPNGLPSEQNPRLKKEFQEAL